MQQVLNRFEQDEATRNELVDNGIRWDEVVYVEFVSPWGYELNFERLIHTVEDPHYLLLSTKREAQNGNDDPKTNFRYRSLLMLKKGGISHFITQVTRYLERNGRYRGEDTGKPASNDLIANIEDIQLATLAAFWAESSKKAPFPTEDEVVWWEVWFHKQAYNADTLRTQLQLAGADLGVGALEFPEHIVQLVKASARQLSGSLFLLDSLSELRKPQQLNDFITDRSVTFTEKQEWLDDLIRRTDVNGDPDKVLVCLLDSGVNHMHPLLQPLIPGDHLHTWNPDWGVADSWERGGHGTGMAGLAFYGDLTEALASPARISIVHGVESFKIVRPGTANDAKLYGIIYRDGCNTVLSERPNNQRVYCLAITNEDLDNGGRPTSSAAAIDKLCFGGSYEGDPKKLFIVSGGNVWLNHPQQYPNNNFISSVKDPGQAYNAITVGAFTQKDKMSNSANAAIAPYGGMSPFNSTSAAWEGQWPNKPDIVMEGGNQEIDGNDLLHNDQLNPLSIDKNFNRNIFIPFGGTSGASAMVANMASMLQHQYPDLWPETIRGLLIHSAEWTPAMLAGKAIHTLSENERRSLIRSVGYGVPNISKAVSSANNSLTLIAQEHIIPYKLGKSNVRYNEYHLYELPWPRAVLLHEVAEKNATITITLSYFIEPNPGNRQYARSFSYHSHSLDFKLIKPGESLDHFQRRVSAASVLEEEDELEEIMPANKKGEDWFIKERVRNKGSIKKDMLTVSGAELADRHYLAIFPKAGWYRTRKRLNRYNTSVRYSLIISIETPVKEVDIYTPVEMLIAVPIPISS
ncbi:MAG: S8 family peptidase [Bacteroidetes bacterium]|uniref:S8 family peptidase n=1 Tax=Phnomibacter sp. TaxID=2836217 RepID=UPI002FDD688D|nr:S8 family peptidase [Bacteroidota bacterium]